MSDVETPADAAGGEPGADADPPEEGAPPADEVEALRAELAALKDQVLRVAADAENTRRRVEREANDARAYAIQKFSRDLLGVADNLQRAMQHAPRDSADPLVKNLAVGLELTERELMGAFERNGLKRLDPARGAKFDPHQHQAMQEQEASDVPPGAIVQVVQSGYELFGRLVRPAMVIVAARGAAGRDAREPGAAHAYAPANDVGASVDTKA